MIQLNILKIILFLIFVMLMGIIIVELNFKVYEFNSIIEIECLKIIKYKNKTHSYFKSNILII